jgi:hypothetical protein
MKQLCGVGNIINRRTIAPYTTPFYTDSGCHFIATKTLFGYMAHGTGKSII